MNDDDPRLLLPWYLSDTLSSDERARVRALLAASPAARDELDGLLRLRGALQRLAAGEPSTSARAHAELLRRLDGSGVASNAPFEHDGRGVGGATQGDAGPPSSRAAERWRAFASRPWVPAAAAGLIVAQFAVIVGTQVLDRPVQPAALVVPRGLDAPTARYRLRFRPDAPAADVATTLRGHRLRVVAGPDATGAWVVELRGLEPAAVRARIDAVRREPAVAAVEAFPE